MLVTSLLTSMFSTSLKHAPVLLPTTIEWSTSSCGMSLIPCDSHEHANSGISSERWHTKTNPRRLRKSMRLRHTLGYSLDSLYSFSATQRDYSMTIVGLQGLCSEQAAGRP